MYRGRGGVAGSGNFKRSGYREGYDKLKWDMGGMKWDMGGTKWDMGGTKWDMGGTKWDMGGMKWDMGGYDELGYGGR